MITDEMRRNAPVCQKHGEQMELAENADDSEVAAYCRTCCVESKTHVDLSSRSMRMFMIVVERPWSIRFDWGEPACVPFDQSIHRVEANGLVYLRDESPREESK